MSSVFNNEKIQLLEKTFQHCLVMSQLDRGDFYRYVQQMLNTSAEEARAEQREECWHKSQHFLSQAGAWDCMQGVREACINATGESDE